MNFKNRVIKFRAWNHEFGDFAYADLENPRYDKREFYLVFDVGFSRYPEGGWFYQQFTGVKDRNEKEIYEGDITENGYSIGWHLNKWGFFLGNQFEGILTDDCEIVGNIFENPELLK